MGNQAHFSLRKETSMAAKMNERLVRAIRKGAAEGASPREIAMLYKLATETVRRIIRHETWAHVADVEDIVAAAAMRAEKSLAKPMTAEQAKAAMESQDRLLGLLGVAGKVVLPEPAAVNPIVARYLEGDSTLVEREGDLTE